MATFVYEAIDPVGRQIKGRIEAESENLVVSRLHDQKLQVVSVNAERAVTLPGLSGKSVGGPKLQALVVFSRQFATMIDAGIAMLKCLDILESQTKDIPLKTAINAVRRDVKGGSSLGDALAKHPKCFSKLYVNMVKAAELGGILDSILDRLASFLETEMEIRQKIQSAMMYPVIVLCFSILMIFALFYLVLPRFKEIFADLNVPMPAMTTALFAMSDWIVKYVYLIPIFAAVFYFGVKKYGDTPQGRMQIDTLKLKAPIVGDLILKMAVSRFSRTFGTLVAAGVPMMRAMDIIGETAGNAVLAKAIRDARQAIKEGQRFSTPLAASGIFPQMVTHMIDIGEETGRLSEMLCKVADFYDKEVDASVKGLTSMIEPMLIVFMGVVVGFIAISVMAPMFKLVSSIN
ncbi:MAG TPA: type II secretion system F family protein [Armatimonadaceae bacterium]|jgi:type IV pilus assembly protein PilC|nr:type II secretion system F family protein [Armatimonadaceae bacterium]